MSDLKFLKTASMLGMLINANAATAPSAWKAWIDYIMKKKEQYGIQKATMVHFNGLTASSTKGFVLNSSEVKKLKQQMDKPEKVERVTIQGGTYIVKSITSDQLVAFNGNKYYIVGRSSSMLLFILIDNRAKCEEATAFLKKLIEKLKSRSY